MSRPDANSDQPDIHERRKADHIRINLEEDVTFKQLTTGLERYFFMHQALPELDMAAVDTSLSLFGKVLQRPLLISSMTGGTEKARAINRVLAEAAQHTGMAMGLGSMRAGIEDPSLENTYRVRDVAPDILLFANLGAVQLNYGYGLSHCQRAVDMIEADALILHFNALQEAVQPEGDGNFAGLYQKVEAICRQLPVPVIAKEVGWGFAGETARRLADAGVAAIDVAGAGGTSWSQVEMYRAPTARHARVAGAFVDWGIPTAVSVQQCHQAAPHLPIFASGGIKTGIEVAKCIALGANIAGLAGDFLRAADTGGVAGVIELAETLTAELRVTMFVTGATDLQALAQIPLHTSF
ncbi:MAG: type 2 isopentenyl-diphosphate Delta-isomerase [Ardenticatenaceae bacterium]|nr:type 2 isopentenyl-diphosphate Delta-isomerase [Anaerolineales bacterium]MCB8922695.1 type 2 isopentenyl-diphosphate Delta-isomerase [Ardenticatenaceae bacterium]MCB8991756.1 type 2 isopentenyl-diphosphate Delta-isomerase [Ardenticatenaceae bacterium]MCB9003597.1 type 2 isopentenyl-diphosphate Delta-isomerase [Ardenticatenaceae bacterium]